MFEKKKTKKFKSPEPAKVIQPKKAPAELSSKDAAAGVKPNRIPHHTFKPRVKDEGQHNDGSHAIARANAVKAEKEAKLAAKLNGDGAPHESAPVDDLPPGDDNGEGHHADE